jgi:single-stranded-DNA-specific exonuclease
MQYQLYENSKNNYNNKNLIEDFLRNRGIDDPQKYLRLGIDVVNHFSLLDNIDDAVELFKRHFDRMSPIAILIDEDADGFCSAAMMYLYIKRMNSDYPVEYIMHGRAKAHGLGNDVIVPSNTKLLIIPDAATNDTDECHKLQESGIDILILDHHEREHENPYAIIVNNQISDNYPNKEFCGAGIVYKFLQALDYEYWQEYAEDFLDLVALANISDVMDMRSYETKFYVNLGLKNIKNKCFQALINAQDYSMHGKINIHNVQFYVTPVINGCIRFGSQEEKELLFRAFIEMDETFEYKKRATKDKPAETIQESIYDRAARLAKNAKARQDKAKDKGVADIISKVGELDENDKVVMVDVTDILDSSLTGVTAIKIAEHYNRPCFLLNRFSENEYGGSARNFDHSPIKSLKDVVNGTGIFNGAGHANAFGIISLSTEDSIKAKNKLNDMLKNVEYVATYDVDYSVLADNISVSLITDLDKTEDLIGQGIPESMIAVEDILLNKNDISVFGKNSDTISFMVNDIKFIMFKCDDKNPLYNWVQDAWNDDDSIKITIVGTPGINEYEGVRTPQIIIKDVEILENNISEDDEVEW